MSNEDIIYLVLSTVHCNSKTPTGNHWYLWFPASFQEDINKLFGKFLQDSGEYHFAGNIASIKCKDYKPI